MKKYRFHELDIEITRKCNKKCVHCMRGEAQPLTMSEEIIDRVFDEVKDVKRIVFGNGEALLEVERISYFINKLVKSQWSTQCVEVTTNGILCDERIVDIFEQFCLWEHGRHASLRISNDQYHSPEEYEHAYAFYKPLVDAANTRIKVVRPYSRIDLHYVLSELGEEESKLAGLVYTGRAVELDGFVPGENAIFPYCYRHRIKISDGVIPCALQISANGNVTFCESASYSQLDEISIGNILESSLFDLINENNEKCPVLCSENELLHRIRHSKYNTDLGCSQKDAHSLLGIICNSILNLRYQARELFPYIPAQLIIERLPFPDPIKFRSMIMAIYKQCPCYTENMIINIKKYTGTPKEHIYIGAMCNAILFSLKSTGLSEQYPYWLLGVNKDVEEYLMRLFEDSNLRYEVDPQEACNTKVFPCEPLAYNIIDYSEESVDSGWDDYSIQMAGDAITMALEELKQKKGINN